MELRQLRYLISVIDFGSFSKASGQLNIAQPALSQQITNLESELGRPLLVRSGRGVSPTEAGLRLYRQAQVILAQVEEAKSNIRTSGYAEQFVGQVSVGLPTSAATMVALPYLQRMRSSFPGVHLRIVESLSGHLLEMLLKNRIDLAVQFRDDPAAGLEVVPLLTEDLFWVSCDAENAGRPISLREIATLPVSVPGKPHAMRLIVDQACQQQNLTLDVIADVDSLPALRGIAATGLAGVILPQSALAESSVYGSFFSRPIEPSLSRPLSLCRSKDAPRSRAMQAAEETLSFTIKDLVESGTWRGVRLDPALATREPDRSLVPRTRQTRRSHSAAELRVPSDDHD
ncbi:LysR substrate-binding domain-containing protein [Bradyrhizobium sp. AS23.2]|uniref:LysR substrate-binding domain-containing protein n=1 Tax=Bradyrhizobium sp. AS23.2 TaxID=1680155 RepID=UPI00093E161F|nr:LysR substrate-binding domain-containing protein [Bradyrhizobium sp. AS23.2]